MENWAEDAGFAVTIWDSDGIDGLVELSLELPAEMPRFVRKP